MSLKKIAELSGVSVSTVSKAFSGSTEISGETKEKIFKVAKEYGYYEKYMKERYPEKIIGVICPEINSERYSKFISCLDEEIRKHNAVMVVSQFNFDYKRAENLFRYYSKFGKVDGIITFASTCEDILPEMPAVSLSHAEKYIDNIYVDYSKAIYETVKYLKGMGRKKIAFIGEKLTQNKEKHFVEAMKNNRLPLMDKYIVRENERFYDAGFCGMEHFFETNDIPDAIVAAYDYIAIGAIRSIKSHGLKFPEDISVVGMDNISLCEEWNVPLTTIADNVEKLAETAVEMLFKKIKRRYEKRKTIVIEAELVVRESVVKKI